MRNHQGFTIVEALVAMAILSVGLIALYGVGADLLQVPSHVTSSDRAVLYAQSKLDSIALNPAPLPRHEQGTEDGFQWEVTAEEVPGNTSWGRQILQNVCLSLTWQAGAAERHLSVTTRHLGKVAP